jgi:hypothetical protein
MFAAAGDDQAKIDAINKMGAYINTTVRNTNTEPTLLDVRVNQSVYARAMGVFTQFLISHSLQDIGRRRRMPTNMYGVHLAGLLMMEMFVGSVLRRPFQSLQMEKDRSTEDLTEYTLRNASNMPLLGSYQLAGKLVYELLANTRRHFNDKVTKPVNLPSVYESPTSDLPTKGLQTTMEIIRGLTGG